MQGFLEKFNKKKRATLELIVNVTKYKEPKPLTVKGHRGKKKTFLTIGKVKVQLLSSKKNAHFWAKGEALCSVKDDWDFTRGFSIALARALKDRETR